MGCITPAATGGQLVILSNAQYLLGAYDWVYSLIFFSMGAMMILPLALGMSGAARDAEKQALPSNRYGRH